MHYDSSSAVQERSANWAISLSCLPAMVCGCDPCTRREVLAFFAGTKLLNWPLNYIYVRVEKGLLIVLHCQKQAASPKIPLNVNCTISREGRTLQSSLHILCSRYSVFLCDVLYCCKSGYNTFKIFYTSFTSYKQMIELLSFEFPQEMKSWFHVAYIVLEILPSTKLSLNTPFSAGLNKIKRATSSALSHMSAQNLFQEWPFLNAVCVVGGTRNNKTMVIVQMNSRNTLIGQCMKLAIGTCHIQIWKLRITGCSFTLGRYMWWEKVQDLILVFLETLEVFWYVRKRKTMQTSRSMWKGTDQLEEHAFILLAAINEAFSLSRWFLPGRPSSPTIMTYSNELKSEGSLPDSPCKMDSYFQYALIMHWL